MISESEMIQHLEKSGWEKTSAGNWRRKHWREAITTHKTKMTFGEWDDNIVGRQSIWVDVPRTRVLDQEGYYVTTLKKAYGQQRKIDTEALEDAV